jgi:hypothetical protein
MTAMAIPRAVSIFLEVPRNGTVSQKLGQQNIVDEYGGNDDFNIFHGLLDSSRYLLGIRFIAQSNNPRITKAPGAWTAKPNGSNEAPKMF